MQYDSDRVLSFHIFISFSLDEFSHVLEVEVVFFLFFLSIL